MTEIDKHSDIFDSLERIERSGVFGASDRSAKLLRYLVEEELAERGERIKAYSIALDIFEKGEDFNPSSNSLVRVETLRLRNALEQYHNAYGNADKVRIELKPGSYRPVFVPLVGETSAAAQDRPQKSEILGKAKIMAAVLLIVGIGAVAYYYFKPFQNPARCASMRPYLSVELDQGGVVNSTVGAQWKSILRRYLAYYPALSQSERRAEECPGIPRYSLKISNFTGSNGRISAILTTDAGEYVWSSLYQANKFQINGSESPGLAKIAYDVGTETGAVATDAVTRPWGYQQPFAEYQCKLRVFQLFESPIEQQSDDVVDCMKAVIAQKPRSADIYGTYAALQQHRIRATWGIDVAEATRESDAALAAGDAINPADGEILMVKLRVLRNNYPIGNADTGKFLEAVESSYTMEPRILSHAATNYATQGNYQGALRYMARIDSIAGRDSKYYWPRMVSYIGLQQWDEAAEDLKELKSWRYMREQIMLLALAAKIGDEENVRFARDWLAQKDIGSKEKIFAEIDKLHFHTSFKQALFSGVEESFR